MSGVNSYKLAVVGLGRVASEILDILYERSFPIEKIDVLSLGEDIGKRISFAEEQQLVVKNLENFDFANSDFVFFCAGAEIARNYAEKIGSLGVTVIDCSSAFREDEQSPLVIPEINADSLYDYRIKGIIASPNCVVVQLAMVLYPLEQSFGIKRVVLSTYQSVSGAGSEALDELFNQTRDIYVNRPIVETKKVFTKQIAFNLIPHIGDFLEDSYTSEEKQIITETQKILNSDFIIDLTCVRVPVFIGHSMTINVELEQPATKQGIKDCFNRFGGLSIADYDVNEGYATPVEVAGEDNIYISRIRVQDNIVNLWVSADNLRKGAALNMVQIAEKIIKLGI